MPNMCYNLLDVACSDEQFIVEFRKMGEVGDNHFSLSRFFPTPEELLEIDGNPPLESEERREYELLHIRNTARYGVADYGEWRSRHWGTNRDTDCARLLQSGPTFLQYDFATAWTPPVAWLRYVAACYPSAEFSLEYKEINNGILGIAMGIDGAVENTPMFVDSQTVMGLYWRV